jgi:S1-C subfamily serine protease
MAADSGSSRRLLRQAEQVMAAKQEDWQIPPELQPYAPDFGFDLDRKLDSVVALTSRIPVSASTAETLGTERAGNAVLIGPDNLLLTIGYLIVEAKEVWLTTNAGRVMAGHVVGYDYATGFGLVAAQEPLQCEALRIGDSRMASRGDRIVLAGAGGREGSVAAQIVARQQFAGYWEYVLDNAIFTAPAHPRWGGAGLIGPSGELWGIGSLQVPHQLRGGQTMLLNMCVPTEALLPVFEDLRTLGRVDRPQRPWLGIFAAESQRDGITIIGVAAHGPASRAGLREGDLVLSVGGREIAGLADFFKAIWSLGRAGVDVPLKIDREGDVFDMRVTSGDRYRFLRREPLH